MVSEKESSQNLETSSPQWDGEPSDRLKIPLDVPYSDREWDRIFTTFIELLQHQEYWVWDRAINKLIHALEMEQSQHKKDDDDRPEATAKRMGTVFDAIVSQTPTNPDIFAIFCARCHFLAQRSPYQEVLLERLEKLALVEDRQTPTPDEILAAQLFFGAYTSSWQDVGNWLLQLLDRTDLNVRACAAYQISRFYALGDEDNREQTAIAMPPIETMVKLMRDKEIERPGVVGAFLNMYYFEGLKTGALDIGALMLDILENSPHPEPYIPYFPCNLEFYAHERFSRNPVAIRRLINMGRDGLALAAATDESKKIPSLEPLLIELGHFDDPETIRIASWHLAYYYHYLHPRGAELGYVELLDELSDIDLFLLFPQPGESSSPYAVVIYPKERGGRLSQEKAKEWVERIFPDTVRGPVKEDVPPDFPHWYQRGNINYHLNNVKDVIDILDFGKEPSEIDNVIIDYRSRIPWNPKQFL